MVWGLVRASSAARASISSRYSSRGGGLTAFASHWGQQRSVETAPTSRLLASYAGETDEELMNSGYKRLGVNWYPGHIAKAERQLSETLKAVDVVVEVRDARVCKASSHPKVGEWCAGRPRIVVLTHLDMIPRPAANAWRRSYELFGAERWDDAPINTQVSNQAKQAQQFRVQFAPQENSKVTSTNIVTPVEQVLFVNAKQGQGIHALHRAIFKAGAHVQERRDRRGLKERPLRVGIIGYPNVGKVG
jgi:ribosome biogenesis GTPase A